jgi:hypothetical protein
VYEADEPYADFVSPGFSDAKDVAARHPGIIGEAAGILIKKISRILWTKSVCC